MANNNKKKKIKYNEISKAKVTDSRNIVVSGCSKGGFTIAQQLETQDGDKKTCVFLKGAFHVDSVAGLYELRDALNIAIDVAEREEIEEDEWD